MKIGVIGIGVVGKPLFETLKYYHEDVCAYDIKVAYTPWCKLLETEIIFVCVPTGGGKNGRLKMNNVDGTLQRLQDDGYRGLVVIKSTLGVGYITKAMNKFNFEIAVFPEWLRALHALPDTLKPDMTILGTKNKSKSTAGRILSVCCWHDSKKAMIVLPEEAVLIKLTANSLASTKISFANQIYLICKEYGVNSNTIMNAIKLDPRCAPIYLTPGEAFGGECLPKDTEELSNCISPPSCLLTSVMAVNKMMKEDDT